MHEAQPISNTCRAYTITTSRNKLNKKEKGTREASNSSEDTSSGRGKSNTWQRQSSNNADESGRQSITSLVQTNCNGANVNARKIDKEN